MNADPFFALLPVVLWVLGLGWLCLAWFLVCDWASERAERKRMDRQAREERFHEILKQGGGSN